MEITLDITIEFCITDYNPNSLHKLVFDTNTDITLTEVKKHIIDEVRLYSGNNVNCRDPNDFRIYYSGDQVQMIGAHNIKYLFDNGTVSDFMDRLNLPLGTQNPLKLIASTAYPVRISDTTPLIRRTPTPSSRPPGLRENIDFQSLLAANREAAARRQQRRQARMGSTRGGKYRKKSKKKSKRKSKRKYKSKKNLNKKLYI